MYVSYALPCRRFHLLDPFTVDFGHRCLDSSSIVWGPKILFIINYRPPNSNPDFYMSLEKMIDVFMSTYNEVIVVGDFNVDLITVKGSCKLSTIFQDEGMKQIISASTSTRVTRCSAALVDPVYVTHAEQIIESLVPIYGLSDHYPVCFVHRSRVLKSPKSQHDTIKYGASRILTRIVLVKIYTLLHGRCLTCRWQAGHLGIDF